MKRGVLVAKGLLVAFAVVAMGALWYSDASAEARAGDVSARTMQDTSAVEMKIFTTAGFVAFTVGSGWSVLSMQSQLPIATAVLQLPNPADGGTPDSTNLVLMLYAPDSERGRATFEAPVKQYGETAPGVASLDEWTIYHQKAKQGGTVYSILDAKRGRVADVSVSVRLAWPHLLTNPATYDAEMESAFRAFLASVHGAIGPYMPAADEVIRRPEK
jgi:hypothetical protein